MSLNPTIATTGRTKSPVKPAIKSSSSTTPGSKITITPIVEPKKLSLKPPRYGYISYKDNKINTDVKKSPEPKSSSKLSSLKSHGQVKDPLTGDLDLSTDTTTSEVDRDSIIQLSERLKRLREKLYENRQELGSFDFGREDDDNDNDNDTNEHDQEIEIINDDEKARRGDNMDESSESSENENERSDKTFTLGKTTKSRRKEPPLPPPPPISSITIRPKDNRESFNTDSLDLKTIRLIEKSESSSIIDRLISSDGLSSSRSTSISSVSSDYRPDVPPFRPEFIKYLENQSKPSSVPVNPEDDILYQWRLRRKMEEAQKEASIRPIQPAAVARKSPELSETIGIKSQVPEKKQPPSPRPQLVSTQVQTIDKVDLATQTSLEMVSVKQFAESEKNKEKPTRDTKVTASSKNPSPPPPPTKSNSTTSPPKKKQTSKPAEYSNTDLTKVSNLESPTSVALPSPSTIVLSNSSSSSLSASTMTNITSRMASPYPQDLLDTNRERNNLVDVRHSNNTDDDDFFLDAAGGSDEIFESDEILQIFLRQKLFYETKLRQIDDLLANFNK